jgi:hypothetical protein
MVPTISSGPIALRAVDVPLRCELAYERRTVEFDYWMLVPLGGISVRQKDPGMRDSREAERHPDTPRS